jgi:hypothetical protein
LQRLYQFLAENKAKTDGKTAAGDAVLPKQFAVPCLIPNQKIPEDGRWAKTVTVWFSQPDDGKGQITDAMIEKVFGKAKTLCVPASGSSQEGRGAGRSKNDRHMIRLKYPLRVYQIAALQPGEDWSAFDNGEASHLCGNGDLGCFNRRHMTIEPKAINLDRKKCWVIGKCIKCTANILTNRCEGHKDSTIMCNKPSEIGDVCTCFDWNTALK